MSKTYALTAKQLEAVKSGDNKGVLAIVKSCGEAYTKLSARLRVVACVAGYQASQFGNTQALDLMYSWLKKNDQTALRNWIGEASRFTVQDKDGNDQEINWATFRDDKFIVKKNTSKIRYSDVREAITFEAWLAMKPFNERDNVEDAKQEAFDLLKAMQQMAKRTEKIEDGENEKFYFEHNDTNDMLAFILSRITSDKGDISKVYAHLANTKTIDQVPVEELSALPEPGVQDAPAKDLN